jgi:glucose-6-phosphate isomerase
MDASPRAGSDSLASRLAEHRQQLDGCTLASLFDADPERAQRFHRSAAGITLDFSRQPCTDQTLALLAEWAIQKGLVTEIDRLFSGAKVNGSEGRAALHTALRASSDDAPHHEAVCATLARMAALVDAVHGGKLRGFSGLPIRDVVSIGIGGSDLGPRFATAALHDFRQHKVRIHFVANVDPDELGDTLADLDPATTLLIVASKSFTTQETLANGAVARGWLQQAAAGAAIAPQLIAITAKPERAVAWGVPAHQILPMWDWVGGRYSVWSAIGLPLALSVGWDHFITFLRGGEAMDRHYREAAVTDNLPVLLALLECWLLDYFEAHSVAVLPYAHRLRHLPVFLQQLSMESLGKRVGIDGQPLPGHSGTVIWGEVGSNCQHSFLQLLHQGTRTISVEFIAVARGHRDDARHAQLFASCLSQAQALMHGRSAAEVERELRAEGASDTEIASLLPHKVQPGNHPSSTLVLEQLTPATLGALIALYEHKVHAQSVLWGINPFDQWGVELGKQIAGQIEPLLLGSAQQPAQVDGSTRQLVELFRRAQRP